MSLSKRMHRPGLNIEGLIQQENAWNDNGRKQKWYLSAEASAMSGMGRLDADIHSWTYGATRENESLVASCWGVFLFFFWYFLALSGHSQPIFFSECSLCSLHFEDVNVLDQYCLVITFHNIIHGVLIISCRSFPLFFSIPPMSFSHGSSVSIFVEKSFLVSFPGQTRAKQQTEKSQKPPKANRSEETAGSHGISKNE